MPQTVVLSSFGRPSSARPQKKLKFGASRSRTAGRPGPQQVGPGSCCEALCIIRCRHALSELRHTNTLDIIPLFCLLPFPLKRLNAGGRRETSRPPPLHKGKSPKCRAVFAAFPVG